MSTLFTATSNQRPVPASTGDMYFETDTNKIILYNGTGWSEYSPAAAGESIDDSIVVEYAASQDDLFTNYSEQSIGDIYMVREIDKYAIVKATTDFVNNHAIYINYKGDLYQTRARTVSTSTTYDFLLNPTDSSSMIATYEQEYPAVFGTDGVINLEATSVGDAFEFKLTLLEEADEFPIISTNGNQTIAINYYGFNTGLHFYNITNEEPDYSIL